MKRQNSKGKSIVVLDYVRLRPSLDSSRRGGRDFARTRITTILRLTPPLAGARRSTIFLTFAFLLFTFLYPIPYTLNPSYAQSLDISNSYPINDAEAVSGDLLVTSDKGLARATNESSSKLFGVLAAEEESMIVMSDSENSSGEPVSRSGTAMVNVSTINGSIKSGDYIATSNISGKGQKGTVSGYVIGVAMADFDESTGEKTSVEDKEIISGKVPVAIKIEYAEINTVKNINRFTSSFGNAFVNSMQSSEQFFNVFRYLIAGLVVMIGFILSFFTFSRSIPKGVEAIGRNPLAKGAIYISIVMNIVFTLIAAGISVAAAIAILKF